MADWREMERALVDALRHLGMRPKVCADYPYTARTNGDWFVKPKGEINVTELAKLLAEQ